MIDRHKKSSTNSPIWITGARGFIGTALSQELSSAGLKVVGFVNSQNHAGKTNQTEFLYSGGVSSSLLTSTMQDHGAPCMVYHLAGGATVGQSIVDPYSDFCQSVDSTAKLLSFLKDTAPEVPVLLASSAAVYGNAHESPISSTASLNPFSPYGHHKKIVEDLGNLYAQTYEQSISVVRLFSVYGDGLRKQLLWDLCVKLARGEIDVSLGGTGYERRDWCHIDDVVQLLQRIETKNKGICQIHNGGTGQATTVMQIANLVIKSWGSKAHIVFSGQSRKGDPRNLIADPSEQPKGFKWKVPVSEGIDRYVHWFKTHYGI